MLGANLAPRCRAAVGLPPTASFPKPTILFTADEQSNKPVKSEAARIDVRFYCMASVVEPKLVDPVTKALRPGIDVATKNE